MVITPSEIKIGSMYKPIGKDYICTVIDVYKTYNHAGELVHTRYVSTHKFCGQLVYNYDVLTVTIQRGYIG